MPEPEPQDPSKPESSPDATQRLPVGVPLGPESTLRMDVQPHLNADITQKLTLLDAATGLDRTQRLLIPKDEPSVQTQKIDRPAETLGQTQRMEIRPEISRPFESKLPLLDPAASSDQTQRLLIPKDESSSQTQKIERPAEVLEQTQKMGIQPGAFEPFEPLLPPEDPAVSLGQTQKLMIPRRDEPPIRVQKVDQPAEAEGQTQNLELSPEASKRFGWKLPLGLSALLVLGVTAYLMVARMASPRSSPSPAVESLAPGGVESVPPAARVYFDQAQAGDAHAMRMLGAMYYYGLNVPRDRDKGLYWYRKAAEMGSDAARIELSKIEGGH